MWRGLSNQMAWAAGPAKTLISGHSSRACADTAEKTSVADGASFLADGDLAQAQQGTENRELGADYFDRIEPRRWERQAVSRLELT
jgi:hypothetical protein